MSQLQTAKVVVVVIAITAESLYFVWRDIAQMMFTTATRRTETSEDETKPESSAMCVCFFLSEIGRHQR